MPTQHFYIYDENYLKLKKEDNMSLLINQLLESHYKRKIKKKKLKNISIRLDKKQWKKDLLRNYSIFLERKPTKQELQEKWIEFVDKNKEKSKLVFYNN